MATKQTINKDTELEKDTKEEILQEIDYKNEYEKLQEQFKIMQEQFAKITEQQKNSVESEEEAPIIANNKLINVTNLFDGELNLVGNNNKSIGFKRFGMTLPLTFEDLHFACSNHRGFAEEGYFYIHNKEVIKALYLEEEYNKIINKSTIENILKLDDKQIQDIINNTTETIKETIVGLIVSGVKNNKPEYSNKSKIDLISELAGKDIFKMAQDLREMEKQK